MISHEASICIDVVMITYNHEKHIKKAIEGVLMQDCQYKINLIISNDYSKDNTDNIVKEMIEVHPNGNWIDYNLNYENLGLKENFKNTLLKCKSNYIALCDGDDYWTDSRKIQKQIDLLEQHKNVSLCFSKVDILNVDNKFSEYSWPNNADKAFSFENYLKNYSQIPTCSMVFRNYGENVFSFMNVFLDFTKKDYILRFFLGNKGDFAFLNDNTSVYRKHEKGISQEFDSANINKESIELNKKLNHFFNYKYDFFLGKYDQQAYERIFLGYMQKRNVFMGFYYFFYAIKDQDKKSLTLKEIWIIVKSGIKIFIFGKIHS